MKRSNRRRAGLVLMTGLVLAFALASCLWDNDSDKKDYQTDSRVLGEFANLQAYLGTIDPAAFPELDPEMLGTLLSSARGAYEGGDLCGAASLIGDYLEEAQGSRQGASVPMAEDLFNRAWSVRANMLAETEGGTECPGYAGLGRNPGITIVDSDNEQFQGSVAFGLPRFVTNFDGPEGEDPETYTQIFLPGVPVWTSGEGLPDVPMWRRLIAIPRGSTAQISATPIPGALLNLNLYPSQPPRPDVGEDGIDDPPFTIDETTYGEDAQFPAYACTILPVGPYRDLELVQVECAAAQYNPESDTLQLFDGVDFAVSFTGGTGTFITSMTQSPFNHTEEAIPSLLNGDTVGLYVENTAPPLSYLGEEYLIITPVDFRPAAEDLAEFKSDKGILTRVFDLDQIMSYMGAAVIDSTVIDDFIEERYDTDMIRPTYILLLGGYDQIPEYEMLDDHYSVDGIRYDYEWPSDYGYADYQGSALPFFALGRVRVTTLDQAQHYVDKVISYESDPPGNPAFYRSVLEAGYFQSYLPEDCPDAEGNGDQKCGKTSRWFIENSEFAHEFLLEAGYLVQRAYVKRLNYIPEDSLDYMPTWYHDGSFLPEDIGYGSGFAWDGETGDIIAAINNGRFLVTHRDHGFFTGWVDPPFETVDVEGLVNEDLQPVVLSINCLSGHDDFVDRLLVQDPDDPSASTGGAVGVLAATRISYSGYNDVLYRGLIDAVWPSAVEDFGNPLALPMTLGDMHLHAKLYVGSIYSLKKSGSGEITVRAHQTWGDPTLQMWTEAPAWVPEYILVDSIDPDSLILNYNEEGAVVTAYQETEDGHYPLGRSLVVDGTASITYIQEPLAGVPIVLSASGVNAVAALLTPDIEASTGSLSFGSEGTELHLTVTNTGGGTLDWGLADTLPAWLEISAIAGELAAGESEVLTVTVDRSGLPDDTYGHDLVFDTNVLNVEDGTLTVSVSMTVAQGVTTFPLVKTGLTVSYNEDGVIATGIYDDGYWQHGEDFSYTVNEDGTATDNVTGLRWLQDGSDSEYTFATAQSYCSALTLDGGGWRIPNVYEYYTILNFSQDNPAMDHAYFPESTKSYYWTSTPTHDWSGRVWIIREPYADDEAYSSVTGTQFVRCVKGDTLEPPETGRFADNGSGTVLDTWTGLVWEAAASDNGETGYGWEEALAYCEGKTTLERVWHLPNVKQVQSLLAKDTSEPAIDTGFFSGNDCTLWTSTTDVYTNGGDSDLAWAAMQWSYGEFQMGGEFKTETSDDWGRLMGARCVSWD